MSAGHLGLILREGIRGRPCVILVHGLGVDADFWLSPERVLVMAGMAPLAWFLSGGARKRKADPIFAETLARRGFHVATWSQKRPVGPLDDAVEELDGIVTTLRRRLGEVPLILIGHSRGGLVARRWLAGGGARSARGLITMGSPHEGSSLAGWIDLLEPLGRVLDRFRDRIERGGRLRDALERFSRFVSSPGVRELEPGSALLRDISAAPLPEGLVIRSYAGTDPGLVSIPLTGGISNLVLPGSLDRLLPEGMVPREWVPGKGDGLVEVARARISPDLPHDELPFNHVTMAFDAGVAGSIARKLVTI